MAVEQHAGPVHSRIEIDEQPDSRASPGRHHRRVLDQHRDRGGRPGRCDALDHIHLRAGDRIGQQQVPESRLAGGLQLQGGGALGLGHAVLPDGPHDQAQLGGLEMGPPAVGIFAEEPEGGRDILADRVEIHHQRGSEDRFQSGHPRHAQDHCSITSTQRDRNAFA